MSTQITTESQYVDKLSSIAQSENKIHFEILNEQDKTSIEATEKEILEFIESHSDFDKYTEAEFDQYFDQAIAKWNVMKDLVKNATCSIDTNGLEISTVYKKLHQNVEYTSETIFYGIHLKKNVLNNFPKGLSDFDSAKLDITFSDSIALYHILSSITVKGLSKESYAYANFLYTLSLVSGVYTHYDHLSARVNRAVLDWGKHLTPDQGTQLLKEVKTAMIEEQKQAIEEAEVKTEVKYKKSKATQKA